MLARMKRSLFIIAGTGIILSCSGCDMIEIEESESEITEYTTQYEENSESTSTENNIKSDDMSEETYSITDENSDSSDTFGWGITDGKITKTIDSFAITDIVNGSEPVTEFISEEDAYAAYFSSSETGQIIVLSTHNGGQNWNSVSIDYSEAYESGSGELLLSCTQENYIYLLYMTDTEVGGSRGKVLYRSSDGGTSFEKIADISESIQNDPMELVFYDKNKGMILVQNHGYSSFAYVTTDGGITWESLILDFPTEEYGYLDGVSLVQINTDEDIWELTLKDSDQTKYVFHSNDGWVSWILQEE